MLERRIAANGVVYYASPRLEAIGVRHGFSTRIGGVSSGPFASLNLGNLSRSDIRDDEGNVAKNLELFQTAIGLNERERCWVWQVHGGEVVEMRCGEAFESGAKADALVGDDPRRMLCVRTADCVPVLLASADGKLVAAIHSGWRGVIAGAVVNALERVQARAGCERTVVAKNPWAPLRYAARRSAAEPADAGAIDIVAAIGPSIGFDAFEVGAEVLEQFDRAFGDRVPMRRRDDGKGFVDLRAAIRLQLIDAGVGASSIDMSDRCSCRDADEFFSHRRDGGITGRMAALIAPAG